MNEDIEHYFGMFRTNSATKDPLKDIEKNILKRKYRVFFHGANFRSGHKDGLVIKLIPKK